jgi:hypothetical protein
MTEEKAYPCPCCGYLTLDGPERGTFDICVVCGWEDDDYQIRHPDSDGGANKVSLNQARENYLKFGASSEDRMSRVRKPHPDEIP